MPELQNSMVIDTSDYFIKGLPYRDKNDKMTTKQLSPTDIIQ